MSNEHFSGGRHADSGMGEPQVVPAEGRAGRRWAARSRTIEWYQQRAQWRRGHRRPAPAARRTRNTTDGDARLARQVNGQAEHRHAGVLMENASRLVARGYLTRRGRARPSAMPACSWWILDWTPADASPGADKGYDAAGFIAALRERNVTCVAADLKRISKTGTPGVLPWMVARHVIADIKPASVLVNGSRKCSAGSKDRRRARQTKHRGLPRVAWAFALATTAYNLIRLPKAATTSSA